MSRKHNRNYNVGLYIPINSFNGSLMHVAANTGNLKERISRVKALEKL